MCAHWVDCHTSCCSASPHVPPSARQPANHGTHRLQSGNPLRAVPVRPVLVRAVPVRAVPVREVPVHPVHVYCAPGAVPVRAVPVRAGSGSCGSGFGGRSFFFAVHQFGSLTVRFVSSGSIRVLHVDIVTHIV